MGKKGFSKMSNTRMAMYGEITFTVDGPEFSGDFSALEGQTYHVFPTKLQKKSISKAMNKVSIDDSPAENFDAILFGDASISEAIVYLQALKPFNRDAALNSISAGNPEVYSGILEYLSGRISSKVNFVAAKDDDSEGLEFE